jgi:hypothetical protein
MRGWFFIIGSLFRSLAGEALPIFGKEENLPENKKLGPLPGLTVLDFTWVLAGPHAAKTLADVGANERWQNLRVSHDGVTQSSYHINVKRGKK